MISQEVSERILTVGPAAKPQGGIAQLLINYRNDIFVSMKQLEFNAGQQGAIIKNIIYFLKFLLQEFWLLLIDRKIKIVHFHTAAGITFIRVAIGWALARLFLKKTIIHIHAGAFPMYYKKHSKFVRFVLERCDRVVCLSEEWKDFYTSEVGLKNVVIINNVIPTPQWTDEPNDGKFHFLFLGHMIENKGLFDLLEVLKDHSTELSAKMVLHIGGARNEPKIQDFISSNDLGGFVKYEGWVTGDDKIFLLNLCDILILPSYIEGLPMSILEGMSYKMPIISTRVGGVPSLVVENVNGHLMEPGDKQGLFSSIMSYLNRPELIKIQGENSFMRINPYLPDTVSDQLEKMYLSVLDSNR